MSHLFEQNMKMQMLIKRPLTKGIEAPAEYRKSCQETDGVHEAAAAVA
jgi:hypothetical protein